MVAVSIHPSDTWHVVEHHYRQTRSTWVSIALSGFLAPVLTMLALGWGIGSQLDDPGILGTEDYLHFVGPGVLVGAAMLQGGFMSLWSALGALKWDGSYLNATRTPCGPEEVLVGRLLWCGLLYTFSSTLFLVALLLGIGWAGFGALLTPFVGGLSAVAAAAPVLAFTSRRDTDSGFSLIGRLVLTPIFVFSGTFTDVDEFPAIVALTMKVLPTFHGVEIARDLVNGGLDAVAATGHLVVILAWIIGGWWLARAGFRKALRS